MQAYSRTSRIFLGLVALFCLWAVLSRVWVAEDGYITFRSVENLYAGHGLVYNPGVRTESFTHPLWMMGLVLIKGIGLPLHFGAILLGLLYSGIALAILVFRPGREPNGIPIFPFAALALVSISGFRDFATGGMEYSLVYLLTVLLFTGLEQHRLSERPFYFASLCALLYLSRPELGLLVTYYSVFILAECVQLRAPRVLQKLRWKPLFAWAGGILLFAGSYHLFRGLYYHDIFPNTYYAKSGLSSYYIQGLRYLAATLLFAPALWIIGGMVALFPVFHKTRNILPPRQYFAYFRELGVTLILGLYIVRVGGDFMMFRFFLPEILMLALLADRYFRAGFALPNFLQTFTKHKLASHYAGLAFFVLLTFWPVPLTFGSLADERRYFFEESGAGPAALLFGQDHPWGQTGEEFQQLQACLGVDDFWITNSQAQAQCLKGIGLGYFGVAAGPGVKILDEQALPNRDVARRPVLVRWRPGHEHYLDLTHIIHRGAAFCSTGEPTYDRTMVTKAGIVLALREDILATMPDVKMRLTELKAAKLAGSPVIPRLEQRFQTTIETLLQKAATWERDAVLKKKRGCWEEHGPGPDGFFY